MKYYILFAIILSINVLFSQDLVSKELIIDEKQNLENTNAFIITNTIIDENEFLNLYLQKSTKAKAVRYNIIVADQKSKIALQPYMGSLFLESQYIHGTTTNPIPLQNISVSGEPVSKDISINYTNINAIAGIDATVFPTGTYMRIQGGIRDFNTRSHQIDIITNINPPTIETNEFRDKYTNPFLNITLVQPWLKNGFAYNMHTRIIQIASNNTKIAYLQEKSELEEIVLNALIEYHKLILQTKAIAILEISFSNLQDIYNTQNKLRKVGARSDFDLMQLQVKINDLERELTQEKNNLELNFQILESKLNFPLNRNDLNLLDYSLLQDKEHSFDLIYKMVLENSKDLEKIQLFQSNINHSVAIVRNQILPELNTIFSYEWSDSSYKDHPNLNANSRKFNISQNNLYAGLQLKMPLVHIANRSKLREVIAQSNSIEYNKEYLIQELEYVTKEKFNEWNNLNLRLEAQQKNLSLNNSITREALRRYRNSEMSIIDFFEHEENYRQNQLQIAQDEFKKKISALVLEIVQGTLLSTYNIELI